MSSSVSSFFRSTILEIATASVGLSAPHDDYRALIADGESPAMADSMQDMSGCALVLRGIFRLAGVTDPRVLAPYKIGEAVADVVGLCRDAGASMHGASTPPPANGDHELVYPADLPRRLFAAGNVLYLSGPEHMCLVLEATPTGFGPSWHVTTIDGGQRDEAGRETVAKRTRTWTPTKLGIGALDGRPLKDAFDADLVGWKFGSAEREFDKAEGSGKELARNLTAGEVGRVAAETFARIVAVVKHPTCDELDADIIVWCAAISKQLEQDLCPEHGLAHLDVGYYFDGHNVPADAIVVALDARCDVPRAIAYHTETIEGKIRGLVGCKTAREAGQSPSVSLSHEVLEAAVNPHVNGYKLTPRSNILVSNEVCDAVQLQTYEIDGVALSNFVLPTWFDANAAEGSSFDLLGLLTRPFEIAAGGYVNRLVDGKSQDVFRDAVPGAEPMRPAQRSRVAAQELERETHDVAKVIGKSALALEAS